MVPVGYQSSSAAVAVSCSSSSLLFRTACRLPRFCNLNLTGACAEPLCALSLSAVVPPAAGGLCLANCLAGETEVDSATCRTKAGKSYKKTVRSTAKVLSTAAKPMQQVAPSRGLPSGICPKGMRHCGSGKCASDILGANGCMLFADLAAGITC